MSCKLPWSTLPKSWPAQPLGSKLALCRPLLYSSRYHKEDGSFNRSIYYLHLEKNFKCQFLIPCTEYSQIAGTENGAFWPAKWRHAVSTCNFGLSRKSSLYILAVINMWIYTNIVTYIEGTINVDWLMKRLEMDCLGHPVSVPRFKCTQEPKAQVHYWDHRLPLSIVCPLLTFPIFDFSSETTWP